MKNSLPPRRDNGHVDWCYLFYVGTYTAAAGTIIIRVSSDCTRFFSSQYYPYIYYIFFKWFAILWITRRYKINNKITRAHLLQSLAAVPIHEYNHYYYYIIWITHARAHKSRRVLFVRTYIYIYIIFLFFFIIITFCALLQQRMMSVHDESARAHIIIACGCKIILS